MNRNLYRTIFNKHLGALVAVAEITRTRTEGIGRRQHRRRSTGLRPGGYCDGRRPRPRTAWPIQCARCARPTCSVMCPLGRGALAAPPLPTGGTITQGSGTLSQSGNTLTVYQSSQNLACQLAELRYRQRQCGGVPSAEQLLGGAQPRRRPGRSSIYGSLSANGKVFLVNPNGVLFAPGSQVTVGGLVASALGISDADFASGHYRFTQGNGSTGTVTNEGNIHAGSVALIGPSSSTAAPSRPRAVTRHWRPASR